MWRWKGCCCSPSFHPSKSSLPSSNSTHLTISLPSPLPPPPPPFPSPALAAASSYLAPPHLSMVCIALFSCEIEFSFCGGQSESSFTSCSSDEHGTAALLDESEFIEVGYIAGVHGLHGELRVKPTTDFHELRFSNVCLCLHHFGWIGVFSWGLSSEFFPFFLT